MKSKADNVGRAAHLASLPIPAVIVNGDDKSEDEKTHSLSLTKPTNRLSVAGRRVFVK